LLDNIAHANGRVQSLAFTGIGIGDFVKFCIDANRNFEWISESWYLLRQKEPT
jgi:hypothetical protein